MISGGAVTSEIKNVKDNLKTYREQVESLADSWKGLSSENFSEKAIKFSVKYFKTLSSQGEAFTRACNLYEDYLEVKANLKIAEDNLATAKADNDSKGIRTYSTDIKRFENQLEVAKRVIEHELNTVVSLKIGDSISSPGGASVDAGSNSVSSSGFVTETLNGEVANHLPFDKNLIFNVLGGQGDSSACGVYSAAYGYTVLSGKTRVTGNPANIDAVYSAYNPGGGDYCRWGDMGVNISNYNSSKDRLDAVWDEVAVKKKPCIVTVEGSSKNHYVLATGFKQGATKATLKPSDIVILDPAMKGKDIMCYYGQGFKNNFDGSTYGKQVLTFPDNPKE